MLAERISRDNDLFFVETAVVDSRYGLNVIRRKKRYGIASLIPPVFDEVMVMSPLVVAAKLDGAYAIYAVKDPASPLCDFECNAMNPSGDMLLMHMLDGKTSLLDMSRAKFVLQHRDYEEYNLRAGHTQYLWARRGRFYDFIHRESGRLISLPGVIMAYDSDLGIWGQDERGRVGVFTENGTVDPDCLRAEAIAHGGYISLTNYTYNLNHVIDVYGNILNI